MLKSPGCLLNRGFLCPFLSLHSMLFLHKTEHVMDDINEKEINFLFIQEELEQHGEWLCDVFRDAIEKQRHIVTGDLDDSIFSRINKKSKDRNILNVNFLAYGRAFEIAANRQKKKNKEKININRDVWGIKENRKKSTNSRWYARNMYGGLNRLIGHVMYGMSEEERKRLIYMLTERKNGVK